MGGDRQEEEAEDAESKDDMACRHTHTHMHTYTYIYIHMYVQIFFNSARACGWSCTMTINHWSSVCNVFNGTACARKEGSGTPPMESGVNGTLFLHGPSIYTYAHTC